MTKKKEIDGIVMLHNWYVRLEEVIPMPPPSVRVELDLGCGDGEFAVALAQHFPHTVVLASDMLLGRARKVRKCAIRENLVNLHVLRSESRLLVSRTIPDSFLNRIHLLCPDPWPKEKHRTHRFLCSDIMTHLARILKPGGVFHFSPDNSEYLSYAENLVSSSGLFSPATPDAIADVAGFKTGFELLWESKGKKVTHLAWLKK